MIKVKFKFFQLMKAYITDVLHRLAIIEHFDEIINFEGRYNIYIYII